MRRRWFKSPALLVLVVLLLSGCANKWVTSGKIAMNGKNYDKAIADFNSALEENPENGEAHFYLAKCYMEKKEYSKMLPHIEAAEKFYTKGADDLKEFREEAWRGLFEAGRANADAEKWEESKIDFETAITVNPSRFEAYTNAGYVWQQLNNDDSTFFYYSKAHEIAPDEITVLENFASHCFNTKKYDLAETLYSRILEIDTLNAEAMARLGDIYGEKNEFEKAVDYYNRALKIRGEDCNLWFNLGVLYFQEIKDNDNAINAFSRAVDLCPEDINAFVNLAITYIQAKRYDDAIAKLETFVDEHPEDCTGWDLYSRVLLLKGMRTQAHDANKKYEECSGK